MKFVFFILSTEKVMGGPRLCLGGRSPMTKATAGRNRRSWPERSGLKKGPTSTITLPYFFETSRHKKIPPLGEMAVQAIGGGRGPPLVGGSPDHRSAAQAGQRHWPLYYS
jgi:hypothetical protein